MYTLALDPEIDKNKARAAKESRRTTRPACMRIRRRLRNEIKRADKILTIQYSMKKLLIALLLFLLITSYTQARQKCLKR